MYYDNKAWIGTGEHKAYLLPKMANRHGLIAGATGTGKTVTLKVMAEAFSDMGVPCFVSDVKGDLAGMVKPGEYNDAIQKRLDSCDVQNFEFRPYPTIFWDVYGEKGHPIRATISEMGPLLISRMLRLNETQSGVLNILFRIADDEGMLLLDIKDLKAMLSYIGENAKNYTFKYGNINSASVGAIQRAIGILEDQGGEHFFGEPAFNINDWLQTDQNGRGAINILSAEKLFMQPVMYSTFLLWLLSELYEHFPETGDLEKPKMVFFFDEAHLLFNDCPRELMDKIELIVRLIRSKGIGIYFITQNPADIPISILGQLGNRVQHALRAYTPLDQRGVKAAADTFRPNPNFDTAEAITQLGKGEALISMLDESGAPSVVERAIILPPQSLIGTIDDELRSEIIKASPFYGIYDETIDRESAYELLVGRVEQGKTVVETVQTTYIPQFNPYISTPSYQGQQYQQAEPQYQPVQQQSDQVGSQFVHFDPQTGRYVRDYVQPSMDQNNYTQTRVLTPKEQEELIKQQKKEAMELAKAEKERIKEERRKYMDELREERAQRARKNDSIQGRIINSAVSSVGREIGRSLTRGVMGIFKGSKKK